MAQKKKSKQAVANEWYELNKGSIDWTKKFNRDQFRLTSAWKHFVAKVRKHTCDFCSCHSNNIQLHHIKPLAYDLLEKENFASLCYSCHTKISQLSRRKDRSSVPEYFQKFLEQS